VFAHAERWRGLLARSGRSPRRRRGSWRRRDHNRRGYSDDLLFLVVVLIVIFIDFDDDADLDFDLVCVVQFDGLTLEHLCGGGLRLFLVGVDGGVAWFLGHSGSYVADR
jgi:hypothetical protein